MRPRLGEDVRYVPSPDGAYLYSDAGEATLRGKHSYQWLHRLAPYLTGEHELTELTAPLPAAARQMVTDLVGMLYQQGFVTDARADHPHTLTQTERLIYAAEIAFIRYALDSAEYRFQRYRQAEMLLVGAGPLLIALVEASLAAGSKAVRVAAATPEEARRLHDAGQRARRDAEQSVDVVLGDAVGDIGHNLAGADVVFQVATVGHEPDLLRMARVVEQAGAVLGQILVTGEQVWFGPVGLPAQTGAGSAWRRLGALGPADPGDASLASGAGEDSAPSVTAGWLTGPVPALIAGRLCLGAFRALTGLAERSRQLGDPTNVLTRLDLRTLESRGHRFLLHPLARPMPDAPLSTRSPTGAASVDAGAQVVQAAIAALAAGPALEAAQLLDTASACVDPRTGMFGTLDEEDFTQLPLAVTRATISDPCGLLPAWAPPVTVVGYGADQEQARVRTLCMAFAAYGSLAVDARRLRRADPPDVVDGATTGEGLVDGASIYGGASGYDGASVWGRDLVDCVPRLVPALKAFPALAGPSVPYRAPLGAAAGLTWEDAVSCGLRQHCEALLAARLGHAEQPFPRMPLATSLLDERGAELLGMLQTARQSVAAYDLMALLDLPAYALCVGDTTVALCCATNPAEAMAAGLERVLLAWQANTQGRTAYAPTVLPSLPEQLRGPLSQGWQPVVGGTLVDVLTAQTDCRPVAVPLDHDPEAVRILPYAVHVVLLDD
jgi:hypothetical protein